MKVQDYYGMACLVCAIVTGICMLVAWMVA